MVPGDGVGLAGGKTEILLGSRGRAQGSAVQWGGNARHPAVPQSWEMLRRKGARSVSPGTRAPGSAANHIRPAQERPDGEGKGHCQASRKTAPATCGFTSSWAAMSPHSFSLSPNTGDKHLRSMMPLTTATLTLHRGPVLRAVPGSSPCVLVTKPRGGRCLCLSLQK